MNPQLDRLQRYPFEKLAVLKSGVQTPKNLAHINLSIGEPQHQAPEFVRDVIAANLGGLSKYPATVGSIELRTSIAEWLTRRFNLKDQQSGASLVDPEKHVLPVTGTREALFSFAQCIVDSTVGERPLVLMPNPFYQIYEGAALLAGAEPYYINCSEQTRWEPDFDSVSADVWARCQLLYLCSPGNPTGVVLAPATMRKLLDLAERFDFIIASDECYSEIYFDDSSKPPGLLEVALASGRTKFERSVVFHSLSKRSSLPGLRSGFAAGDASVLDRYRLYRTYHGCAMSPMFQAVSTSAWSDETHVSANRELYRKKFAAVLEILEPVTPVSCPDAAFYLWLATIVDGVPSGDEEFAKHLFEECNVTVLPGSYLSRMQGGVNPGAGRVRVALVSSVEEAVEAAKRIRSFITRTACVTNSAH